ncbi:sulfotransferase family protein [Streptomyces sp. CMB-StM0423]|uniref:sulfotransferase family protein n=1 Tax=Streptomyces sp. CMB-StM0423 TaxID=2059884 RepID=UPI0018FE3438|nr:sulfotransferase [Streptomyces sp. CMB-StM0423]
MNLLRKLNHKLGATTGFEIRKAGLPHAPAPKPAPIQEPAEPKPVAQVAYRPPEDPEVDRLLRRPVFIMSPVRSGSTLLRLLLNAHSRLHSAHELHFRRLEVTTSTKLAERAMAELGLERGDLEHLIWDRVLHRELVRSGKDFLVEKTPSNTFAYKRIAACWPDARFIFLLRHPASIARSWYEADPEKRTEEEAALDALRYMRATERARQALPGHVVRYEELTDDPESAMKGICSYLEIDFEPGMLDYGSQNQAGYKKGLGDWKDKIRSGQVQAGRALPAAEEIPEPLREISAAWGYVEGRAEDRDAAAAGREPHAEIAEVWPRDGAVRLTGSLHGVTDGGAGPWEMLLVRRDQEDQQLRYPAELADGGFDVTVPVADLAPAGLTTPAQWDIHLAAGEGDAEVRLRAGRHLDGITGKKNIMVFPGQPARIDGADVEVKPYYTIKDNLSVEVLPAS